MKIPKTLASLAVTGLGAVIAAQALRPRPPYSFQGRSVVITGGSRGLGLSMARQLAAEGARLTLLARTAADLDRAATELRGGGAEVLTIPCDVRDQGQVDAAIARIMDHYGALDVLINNAGIIQTGPLDNLAIKDFEDAMGVHLWGPLYTTLAALPHMRAQGGGRIVNISSIGGLVAVPHLAPYSASKFALRGLSDALRAELAKDNIQVTTVSPGLMRTGSPPNALMRGQHHVEYALFTILDALPVTSIDAQRAARQIIAACRRGEPDLTISVPARAAAFMAAAFPDVVAWALALVNRVLPGPVPGQGDVLKAGWEGQSALAPSLLTRLSDQATVENNELRGHPVPASVQTPPA